MEILQVLKTIDTVISVAKPILEVVSPKLQESMKGFAERMLELSEKYPKIAEFAQMLDKAVDIMGDVLYAFGINADSADIIGAKVAKTDKSVSDFESVEDYITYLQNEIEIDKAKFAELSDEERLVYTVTGLAVEAGVISEKIGLDVPADVVEVVAKIAEIGKVVFETKELVSLLFDLKARGIDSLSDICECIYGEGDSDRIKTGELLTGAIDKIKPGEGSNILNEIKEEVRE